MDYYLLERERERERRSDLCVVKKKKKLENLFVIV